MIELVVEIQRRRDELLVAQPSERRSVPEHVRRVSIANDRDPERHDHDRRGSDDPQVYELLSALMTRFGLPADQNPGAPTPPPPPPKRPPPLG